MDKKDQIFKSVFGSAWNKLSPVFKKRYSNRPFSYDVASVEGEMDIHFSKMMFCLMPFFKLFHVLVPYKGRNIPVKVDFRSDPHSDVVYLDRKFYFPGKKPYEFNSYMQAINENDVVERMAFGISWRTNYFFDGKKVVMQHKRYVWRILGLNIPLPLEFLLGKGYAEEEKIDDNTYRVTMRMTHSLFGVMYYYSGDFTFTKLPT